MTEAYRNFRCFAPRKNEPNLRKTNQILVRHPVHRSLPPSGFSEDGSLWRRRITYKLQMHYSTMFQAILQLNFTKN